MSNQCPHCSQPVVPDRVSVHGMYDCHAFIEITGDSVDNLIANWLEFTKNDDALSKYGPTDLCPAVVMCGKVEVRRVGPMVFWQDRKNLIPDKDELEKYRAALSADPDISRLLAQQPSEEP